MSQLPKGWIQIKLKDAVDKIVGGGTPSKAVPSYFEGDIPWMTVKDMNKTYLTDTIDHITQDAVDNSSTNVIPAGVPIIATRMSLGKIVRASFNSAINQDLKALFVNKEIDKYFFEYWYRSQGIKIESLGTGTTVKGVRLEVINGLDFPLAPFAEQTRIVGKLDEVLAQVDIIKTRLDGIPAILKRFRQSVLAAAVSGKLTEDIEFEKWDEELLISELKKYWLDHQQSILLKKNKSVDIAKIERKYKKPNLSNESNNTNWPTFELSDLILEKNQGVNTTTEKVKYQPSGIPAIQAGNIHSRSINFATDKFVSIDKYKELSDSVKPVINDVLYTNIGANFGNASIVNKLDFDFLITWNILKIKPSPLLLADYLVIVLNTDKTRSIAKEGVSTSTVPFVNGKKVDSFKIPLPSQKEQKEIVRLVDQYSAFADSIEAQVKKAQLRVDNLTQSILAKAFRGELVPQDPSDEPADKLLERIAQARIEAEALAKAAKKIEADKKRAAKKASA